MVRILGGLTPILTISAPTEKGRTTMSEQRLIDANALDYRFPVTDDVYGLSRQIGIEMVKARIAEAPTIEAVPVRHGRWVSLTECANAGVYCSVCHKKVWKEDYAWCNRKNKLRSNYCPNCGAKMDLEE